MRTASPSATTSQDVDAGEVRDLIAHRRMHVVRTGTSEVEIREGDDVRWRGRWTWTAGDVTWSAEWASPAP